MEDYLKIGFDLVGVAIMGVMVRFIVKGKLKWYETWACTLCIFLSFVFGNINQIASFRASSDGVEAKMKEVQVVLDDTKATVASLRELATMTAALQVDMLASQGRWDTSLTHQDQQKEQLLVNLKDLGLTPEQIKKVETADSSWVMRDYVIGILMPLNNPKNIEEAAAYGKAYNGDDPPTPDDCEKLLEQFHISDEESKELLEDYRYYVQHQKQRRPEVWSNRAIWLTPR